MILIGNDNGDFRIADDLITDFKNGLKRPCTRNLKMFIAMLAQMLRHRPLGRIHGISLGLYAAGHTPCMGTPVIHQLWNMDYLFCLIGQTQNHVVVLAAVIFCPEQFIPIQKLPVETLK